MNIELIKATASYHRNIAGLFWILEDELSGTEYFDSPFRLAIRAVLKAYNKLNEVK